MKNLLVKSTFLSMCAAMALTACSSDEKAGGAPDGTPRINARFTEATEAAWDHTLFLFKGDVLDQTAADKTTAFTVESGATYTLKALVIEDKTKLTLPDPMTGVDDQLSVNDLAAGVPDILFGASDPTTVTATQALPISANRLVSKLIFEVTAPAAVTGISVKVSDLNDRITLTGTVSASAAGLSKTLTLTKDAQSGKFVGASTLLPSEATQFNLEYTYTFAAGDPIVKTSTPASANGAILKPNEETTIESTVTDGAAVETTAAITYAAWGTSQVISDNIDLAPEQDLTWAIFGNDNAENATEAGSPISNLMDGNPETGWVAYSWEANAGFPRIITVDMKVSKLVASIDLTRNQAENFSWDDGGKDTYNFHWIVSDAVPTADNWADATTFPKRSAGEQWFNTDTDPMWWHQFDVAQEGRYVNIIIEKAGNGWDMGSRFAEIKVNITE